MLTMTYAPTDAAFAERLQKDLSATDALLTDRPTLIAILSPQALHDDEVRQSIDRAIATRQQIVPVLAQAVTVPPALQGLAPVDLSARYEFNNLLARLTDQVVLTQERRMSNRRIGVVLALLALIMFLMGLYLVGVLGVQFPAAEYEAVDTQAANLINTQIAPFMQTNLPHSTADAETFASTVQAAPTRYRPLLIGTATAIADANTTPVP